MKAEHVYGLRKAGNSPRFGAVAIVLVVFLILVSIVRRDTRATVKETYVERTYTLTTNGNVRETEFKREAQYVANPDKLYAGSNLFSYQALEEAVEVAKEKAEKEEAEKESTVEKVEKQELQKEETVVKHFSESTYIKGAIMLNGEAGGVPSITERSGCLWVACNRVISEDPFFPDDLESVIEMESQFDGYTVDGDYTDADYELAVDVFERFYREQNGEPSEKVGRTIPTDYLYFTGDGKHNYFTKTQKGTPYVWGSQYVSPYIS